MLLTGNGALPPNFFCNKVADVIDAKALNDAIISKVMAIEFEPAKQNGRPVLVQYQLPILFK